MTLVPDCFLSILSDIDGSLFLYYNFCLCNSLKDRAPKERIKSLPVPWDGQVSFADAKVRLFLKPAKTSATFLQGKRYKGDIYIIYIIRARKMGRGRTRLMGKAGVRWHRTIRNEGSMTGGTDGRRGCDGITPYGTGNFTKKKGQFYTARGIGLHSTRRRATQHAASGYTARGIGLHSTRRQTASYGEDSLMSFSEDLEL